MFKIPPTRGFFPIPLYIEAQKPMSTPLAENKQSMGPGPMEMLEQSQQIRAVLNTLARQCPPGPRPRR